LAKVLSSPVTGVRGSERFERDGEMKVQNKLSVSLIVTILILVFSFQVIAQEVEIQGWDKAKFEMPLEELKSAYKEEERYLKEFWEQHEQQMDNHYKLSTSKLQVLQLPGYSRESEVSFEFVDNELFKIIITIWIPQVTWIFEETSAVGKVEKGWFHELRVKGAEEKSKEFDLKLRELVDFLSRKYGEYTTDEKGNLLAWEGLNGNTLNLKISFHTFRYDNKDYALLWSCTITYSDKKLTELWEKKKARWEEKRRLFEEKSKEVF